MSRRAETLVWERSRAKGSNLLVLLHLADCAQQDGRDAWPGVKAIAAAARLTPRGVRFVLEKLEADGEIHVEENSGNRTIEIGSRQIRPQWFIHVRCVCDWEAYQANQSAPSRRTRKGKDFPAAPGKDFPAPVKPATGTGEAGYRAYKEEILERDPRTETPRARVAFEGKRFNVPWFLDEQFEKQLGPKGLARFDLQGWYGKLDTRDDGPIVGDVVKFIRQEFHEETKRRLDSADFGRYQGPDEPCTHTPKCSSPNLCLQLKQIAKQIAINKASALEQAS